MACASRPSVLYLTHRVPYPPDKGDRIRCYHLARYLADRCDLYLACLADEPVPDATQTALRGLCRELAIFPVNWQRWLRALQAVTLGRTISEGAFYVPALAHTLREWASRSRFHAAVASASSLAPYLMRSELSSIPAVLDFMDVDSQKWLDYAASTWPPKSWVYQLEGTRLRKLERQIAGWARAVLLVAQAETELFRTVCPSGPVHTVTNGVDLDYFAPAQEHHEEPDRCIFVGAMDYFPNVDGAGWFCREVWPLIREQRPQASLALVGRNPTAEVQALGKIPGVEVVGSVPDIRPEIRRASVTVVPLRIARGIQNKVLESLAMGKATVISPAPREGLSVSPGRELLVAHSPQQWVEHLISLFNDPQKRKQLGSAGRAYVETHHCWERCLAPLSQLLELPQPKHSPEVSA